MKRDELLRLHALHVAAADALEARLKNEARDEYEEHRMGLSWRLADGTVTTNLAHDGARVSNEEAFMDYLEEHTAAVQRVEVRNVPGEFRKTFLLEEIFPVVLLSEGGDWREPFRKELKAGARFPAMSKTTGKLVPGVEYVHGGSLVSISLKLEDGVKKIARNAAAQYADGVISAEQLFESL